MIDQQRNKLDRRQNTNAEGPRHQKKTNGISRVANAKPQEQKWQDTVPPADLALLQNFRAWAFPTSYVSGTHTHLHHQLFYTQRAPYSAASERMPYTFLSCIAQRCTTSSSAKARSAHDFSSQCKLVKAIVDCDRPSAISHNFWVIMTLSTLSTVVTSLLCPSTAEPSDESHA